MRRRIVEWYHGMFHLAQVTIHDRWVKRLRLIAFLAASSIATQIVLRSALGQVGMGNVLPSSVLTILVASAVWLVARSEEHTSELQSRGHLVCRLLLEK